MPVYAVHYRYDDRFDERTRSVPLTVPICSRWPTRAWCWPGARTWTSMTRVP